MDNWLKRKLAKSAASTCPRVSHEQVMSEAQAIIDTKIVGHNKWFCEQVQASLDDPRPSIPNAEVKEYFASKRKKLAIPKDRAKDLGK